MKTDCSREPKATKPRDVFRGRGRRGGGGREGGGLRDRLRNAALVLPLLQTMD